ncbi:MAG: aspartate kinase [Cyclobacteriaceae bacterium]
MIIMKFGGTSVGKPDRMKKVAELVVNEQSPKIVVLSALSGTTNTLVAIGEALFTGVREEAIKNIEDLYQYYLSFYPQLLKAEISRQKASTIIEEHFNYMRTLTGKPFNNAENKALLAQGELLSTKLFHVYLQEQNIDACLLSAIDFMAMDEHNEPRIDYLQQQLSPILEKEKDKEIFITQGYICLNERGEYDNLKRGGSDYSATLIGAALQASEVQIWTDISGMHNNDPRVVDNTYPIDELSFNEASELAYFGAKILHPSSIWPVQQYNVPVRLKNTMEPEATGTFISDEEIEMDVKAIAAKDQITAIKIKSSRMLMAYGFLRKIFEVFEKYRTPIDMITTSEVAVSLTIDDDTDLQKILDELKPFGMIHVDREQTIVCIVGNLVVQKEGIVQKIFEALNEIPIRMISYGGSKYNISLLIDTRYKNEVLIRLNNKLFQEKHQ